MGYQAPDILKKAIHHRKSIDAGGSEQQCMLNDL
jgi:hypothetical protein